MKLCSWIVVSKKKIVMSGRVHNRSLITPRLRPPVLNSNPSMEQLKFDLSSLHAPIESQVFSSYLLHLSQKGCSLLPFSLTPYPVLPDEIKYDGFKFYFRTPTVPSRVVTLELKVLSESSFMWWCYQFNKPI